MTQLALGQGPASKGKRDYRAGLELKHSLNSPFPLTQYALSPVSSFQQNQAWPFHKREGRHKTWMPTYKAQT